MIDSHGCVQVQIKEINAAGLQCLVDIGQVDLMAAAELFGCPPQLVSRLIELSELDVPVRERIGKLDALADVPVSLFEMSVGPEYVALASTGSLNDEWGGLHSNFQESITNFNAVLVLGLVRMSHDETTSVLAMNLNPTMVQALRDCSPVQTLVLIKTAARPLVSTTLSQSLLDQVFGASSRSVIDYQSLVLLLSCRATAAEIEAADLFDEGFEAPTPVGRGRRVESIYSVEQGETARLIGLLGGDKTTALILMGVVANSASIRRIREDSFGGKDGGSGWAVNSHMRLSSTAVVLGASRLMRTGRSLGDAITQSMLYHRSLTHKHPEQLSFRALVSRVVVKLRSRTARLCYCQKYEGAYLLVEQADGEINAVSPQATMGQTGKIGRPRLARSRSSVLRASGAE